MRLAPGCGRRHRELRFPEGLALSLSLGLYGWRLFAGTRAGTGLVLSCCILFRSSSSLTNQCYVVYALTSTSDDEPLNLRLRPCSTL